MLLLISIACVFLIFLDYHSARNIQKSILFVAVFFAFILAMSFALKLLQFKLLFLVIIIPVVLFVALFLKNRKHDDVDF